MIMNNPVKIRDFVCLIPLQCIVRVQCGGKEWKCSAFSFSEIADQIGDFEIVCFFSSFNGFLIQASIPKIS